MVTGEEILVAWDKLR